jgi:transposase InsO family protein
MRDNSFDRTIERNYLQKWRFLIGEYEEVKAGRSEKFARVGDFYRHHGTCSQSFRKYYNRYLQSGSEGLLPQRRGPKWKTRRMPAALEAEVIEQRRLGLNRYEIYAVLRERGRAAPSPSAIYRAFVRHGAQPPQQADVGREAPHHQGEARRARPRRPASALARVLPRAEKPAYVVSLVDSCSRLAWAEVVESKKALPVMFKTLKLINTLNARYGLVFAEILTDNGAEFAARKRPLDHPFETMLAELGIVHRYTRPYRPQTNGKVERFWRTLEDDLVEGTTFDDVAHLSKELLEYLIYYNEFRPHQALNHTPPKTFAQTKSSDQNEAHRSAN